MDNGKKFFVIDIPVLLHGVEGSGKESDGMELAFLIPLLKDSANRVSGGVAINCELVVKSGLSQDGGCADSVHQGVEGCFKFIVPVKLPSLGAVSDEYVERCGQHAEVSNVHAIEIEETEKCSNFLQGCRTFPILHTLDLDWVHGNGVFPDDNTKVLDFSLFELAFLRFEVKIVNCEDAQDIVYDTAV